jgi:hypothetical protein
MRIARISRIRSQRSSESRALPTEGGGLSLRLSRFPCQLPLLSRFTPAMRTRLYVSSAKQVPRRSREEVQSPISTPNINKY